MENIPFKSRKWFCVSFNTSGKFSSKILVSNKYVKHFIELKLVHVVCVGKYGSHYFFKQNSHLTNLRLAQ